jgi:Fe-S cluster assembly scaffold protein SufB
MTEQNRTEQAAIAIAADELHEEWKDAYFEQHGEGAERWKVMKPASVAWVEENGNVPADALRQGESGQEINIAALTNSQLPPQFSGENTASAKGAIEAIQNNPSADIDTLAAIVHDQWLERNGSWAAEELKKPYDELSEPEKEKDRAVVRVAQKSIDSAEELVSVQDTLKNQDVEMGIDGQTNRGQSAEKGREIE